MDALFSGNPFFIDFPPKKDLSTSDYIEVQRSLRSVEIYDTLRSLHKTIPGRALDPKANYGINDFYGRCSRGIYQNLLDENRRYIPQKTFVQIGIGGEENCVVCFASYNSRYPQCVLSMEKALKKVGYNGKMLYYLGGWPNPTGEEITFCAIPYSFKIFAMYEAYLLGCKNVLWLDAACLPLRDPQPVFDHIERTGGVFHRFKIPPFFFKSIFPSTREELFKLTGTDLLDRDTDYILTTIFGLRMDRPEIKKFLEQYYDMARRGTPFLSCSPEEAVITAIMGQPEFDSIRTFGLFRKGLGKSPNHAPDSPKEYEAARKKGYYFFHRKNR